MAIVGGEETAREGARSAGTGTIGLRTLSITSWQGENTFSGGGRSRPSGSEWHRARGRGRGGGNWGTTAASGATAHTIAESGSGLVALSRVGAGCTSMRDVTTATMGPAVAAGRWRLLSSIGWCQAYDSKSELGPQRDNFCGKHRGVGGQG